MEYSEQLKNIARDIGYFYCEKNKITDGSDEYGHKAANNAEREILNLGITDIAISSTSILVITLSRPGLLIGKQGENINKLTEYLKKHDITSINIDENRLTSYLTGFTSYYRFDMNDQVF